jgi:hypothetical protein
VAQSRRNKWTVEFDGDRYEAVTIEWVQELIHRAVLDAEDTLIALSKHPPQCYLLGTRGKNPIATISRQMLQRHLIIWRATHA